eukprot:1959309-Amphidinium_carterae.1
MLELKEFRLHEIEPATVEKEMVGIVLDGRTAQFRPKASRVWRLFLALEFAKAMDLRTRWELRVCQGLLFMAGYSLSLLACPVGYCSDASLF